LPASVALPFGVFERTLSDPANSESAKKHEGLLAKMGRVSGEENPGILSGLRETILGLEAPVGLAGALRTVMEQEGLEWPAGWDEAWLCIKKVWASKWNDRAYLSREANGIPHDALVMSVLIQRVIESEYSFVIHTINPFTGARDEIYAEAVLGLGETLAANYPGRALGFAWSKRAGEARLLSFPSKSIGIYGGGLIFRSDSNGEDLSGYAGAGLYDSFVMPEPRRLSLDYSGEPLFWDETFRRNLLLSIGNLGRAVEDVLQYPQDIEGAYSKGRFFVVQTRPQVGLENG
ncbi:MAG TPA: PEP/pyruvate-binding domain-containing protein, partial [Thermodesulfovibrionales bacterium]|nr:PEP/pyruvate-binding domain-containing protein [Thermodesulfovibrionales bacterium]